MMLKKYNRIIKELMKNDRNSSFDTLLIECDNNLDYAIEILKEILERLIEEDEDPVFFENLLKEIVEN